MTNEPGQHTGLTATASSGDASLGVDGNYATQWNAGGYPPAWIEIDLKKTARVRKIRIWPSMSPPDTTSDTFFKSLTPSATTIIASPTGYRDNLPWEYIFDTPQKDVRYLRLQTDSSGSWVGSWEYEVYE